MSSWQQYNSTQLHLEKEAEASCDVWVWSKGQDWERQRKCDKKTMWGNLWTGNWARGL